MVIGQRVQKKSGKPFKSGLKVNTVKAIVEVTVPSAANLGKVPRQAAALTFKEDDSFVLQSTCMPVEK